MSAAAFHEQPATCAEDHKGRGTVRRDNRCMKSYQVKLRRLELGLTVSELAYALRLDETEIARIESGESDLCECREFEAIFDEFEERVFGTFAGA